MSKEQEALAAFLDAVDAGVAQARRILGEKSEGKSSQQGFTYDPARIQWRRADGPRGAYEKAEDPHNPEFQKLVKDLQAHNGSFTRDGLYYWLFTDAEVVGRKKTKTA